MKGFLIALAGIVLVLSILPVSNAYVDCAPAACPTGYFASNTTCQGPTCITECASYACTMQWTQVYSDYFGWPLTNQQYQAVQEKDWSNSYTPANTSQCYQFRYEGPFQSTSFIRMFVIDPTNPDCDTQGIGGFMQGSGFPGQSNPWFSGMSNYDGDVGGSALDEEDYMRAIVRGDSEIGSESGIDNYKPEMSGDGSIYCVPNNSTSCNDLGGTTSCDNDCYNAGIFAYATQGYFEDKGDSNKTLYQDIECIGNVNDNRYNNTRFLVYSSSLNLSNLNTTTTCDRINEAPSVSNVFVTPLIPNAGQDISCDFNYTDPENFVEQNSSYEWWKNGINQNIDIKSISKENLTVGDSWYCKVKPSDGLLFGNQIQSQNNVTILTTVKDPTFTISGFPVWSKTGYYGDLEEITGFNQQLNDALSACTPDQSGMCDINLTFTSNATGVMDLSQLEIFHTTITQDLLFNFSLINSTGLNQIFEFVIFNNYSTGNFNWTLEPGDNTAINNTITIPLLSSEDVFVYVEYSYNSTGNYTVKARAYNGTISDEEVIQITV